MVSKRKNYFAQEDEDQPQLVFGPCSIKQQLILQDNSTDVLLCGGGAGGGKALRHGEKVLTPFGFVNIETVRIGDEVLSPDNEIQIVTDVWPQGVVDIYRVTFQDGRSVETCGEHLWEYHRSGRGYARQRVGTTLDLKRALTRRASGRKMYPIVPMVSPLGGFAKELPIAPYVMGAVLGDGHISKVGGVLLTSADDEILSRISETNRVSGGYEKQDTKAKTYGIPGLRQVMRDLGLAGTYSDTKFIPEIYLNGSVNQKFDLVQGLMDTDGYVCVRGNTYYTTTSGRLADDLTKILQSLGFSVTRSSQIASYTKNGVRVDCKIAHTLYIRGKNQKNLFSLTRKKERCTNRSVGLRVESVELIGKDFATCIAVSGERKLFVTTNYVVTHNSHTCLTKALVYIEDPAARVLILRRSQPNLKLSGGLIDESKGIYRHFGGEYKIQPMMWVFPNGATIQFAAVPDDISEWQGLQATNMLVDEAADWTQEEILFLLSRLRGAKYRGHLNLTMTCNPSRESFLYDWVEYSLDPDTGIPRVGVENITRFFINIGSKIYFADSEDELWERHGKDLGLVRKKVGEKPSPGEAVFLPKSFRFIPLTVYDNPVLLKNNPGYLAGLLAQPRVNQLRYLHGSWTARAEGSGYFRREWIKIVDRPPINAVSRVRSWDLAASVVSETNKNPDYTAGVKMSRDKLGYYYIEDVERFRKLSDGVIKSIIDVGHHDGVDSCQVTIPKDPGAGGKAANAFYMRTLAENGIPAKSVVVSGHSGKISRFLPFCTLAESGFVRLVKGEWNEEYLTELELFEGLRTNRDDQVDATADAFNTLSKQLQIPVFSVPNMEMASPLPRI
jgi:predicted phage terminase large subunit-like protein